MPMYLENKPEKMNYGELMIRIINYGAIRFEEGRTNSLDNLRRKELFEEIVNEVRRLYFENGMTKIG